MIEIICKICQNKFNVKFKKSMCDECFKAKRREQCREYKKRNKDKIAEYNKKYKLNNKESISVYNKEYNIKNRKTIQERKTKQEKKRRHTDPAFKLSFIVKNRFKKLYKGIQKYDIKNILGCSYNNYVKWIEFNFTGDMSWDNHGKLWHIDHVLFCCLFNHTDEKDIRICFNWKNTRPLLASVNLKRRHICNHDLLCHEIKLHYFEKNNIDGYLHINFDFAYLTTKLLEKSCNGSS